MKKLSFTLIELLIVVVIISILMSVAIPAIFSAKEKADITKATTQMNAIKMACENYYHEYQELPLFGSGKSGGVVDANKGSKTDYETLLSVLCKKKYAGKGNMAAGNKRGMPFWEPPPDFTNSNFEYKDPWGHYYIIWFDHKDRDKVGTAESGNDVVNGKVHVISYGPDEKEDITESNTQLIWNGNSGDLTTWKPTQSSTQSKE